MSITKRSDTIHTYTKQELLESDIWLKGQQQAFQAAMSGRPLAEALQPLIDTIIAQTANQARVAFNAIPYDKEGLHLVAGMDNEYAKDINGFVVGAQSIACGLAMYSGEPVITFDVEKDPRWLPFIELARKHKCRACWSFPVKTDGGPVLGTLTMHFKKPRLPEGREMEMAAIFAHTAAIIISRDNEQRDRERAEQILRDNEEQLRMFVTANSSSVYRMSADWQEMYSLIGNKFLKNTDQPDNKWISRYILPEDRPNVLRAINAAIKEKTIFEFEHRVVTASGKVGWVHSRAVPVFDRAGNIKEWIGAGSDITARKEAEMQMLTFNSRLEKEVKERTHELQASKMLLQATLDSSLEMIQVFKAVRDKAGRIIDFVWVLNNHAAELRFGNVIGKSLIENNPGVLKEGIFDNFVKVVETGIPNQNERHYVHEQFNGWFYQSIVKLDDGVATNTADITERKHAEERLRRLEKRQQKEILRNTLNAQEEERKRISDNIHNGLGQVLYGVRMSLSNLTTVQAIDHADEFKKNKLYTDKLLSQAITEARHISHELSSVVLEEFGLHAAIDDVCKQFQNSLNVVWDVQLPEENFDKHIQLVIFRSIQELFTNVIKHANATNVKLILKAKNQTVTIAVTDNGQGMVKQQNTGIGLRSIRAKAELLNGSVTISSNAKYGTKVVIIIPY